MDVKFITEVPANEDLFKGQGHSKSADAIRKTIESQPAIKVIGIEGGLGGGKSTIINILKKQLEDSHSAYVFVNFDLQQHHNSSIKEALINRFHDEISLLLKPNSEEHTRLEKIRDVALGRMLNYTKRVKSSLDLLVIFFIFSLPLTVKFFEDAMRTTEATINIIRGVGVYTPSLTSTATCLAGFSVFILLAFLKPLDCLFNRRKWKFQEILGSIVQRNSVDHISEILTVSKDVSSVDLEKAYTGFLKEIPVNKKLILIIDNIDRIEADDFLEVWSDLDIFVTNSNDRFRIVLPYSIEQVEKILDRDKSEVEEFFSKKVAVTFSVPNLITYDWRTVFVEFLTGAFGFQIDLDEAKKCADLIEVWKKDITPRYLKNHINRLASKSISVDSKEFSLLSFCAYVLSVNEAGVEIEKVLASPFLTYEGEDVDPIELKISKTLKILDEEVGTKKRVRAIMCAHFQAPYDVSRSEVLIKPIEDAVRILDAKEVIRLSRMYGFDHYFTKNLYDVGAQTVAELLKNISNLESDESANFIVTWLPLCNIVTNRTLRPIQITEEYVYALKELKESAIDLSFKPLDITRKSHEKALREVAGPVDDKKKEDIIFRVERLYIASGFDLAVPEIVSSPSAFLFTNFLWVKKEQFPRWEIEKLSRDVGFRNEVLNFELDKAQSETDYRDSLGRWYLSKHKIGFERGEDVIDQFPSTLSEYGHIAFSGLGGRDKTAALALLVEQSKADDQEPNRWVTLLFAHLIHNNLLNTNINNGKHNTQAWSYIKSLLDYAPWYDDELAEILTLIPKLSTIIQALSSKEHAKYLSRAVNNLIDQRRINELDIDEMVSGSYFGYLKNIRPDEESILTWLEVWDKNLHESYEQWSSEFLEAVLNVKNERLIKVLRSQFEASESEKHNLNRIVDNASENTVMIVDYYFSNKLKIKNSSKIGDVIKSALKEKSESDFATYSNSAWISKLISILYTNTKNAIVRKYESRLLPSTVSTIEKFCIIRNFHQFIRLTVSTEESQKATVLLFQECNDVDVGIWLDQQDYNFKEWNKGLKGEMKEIVSETSMFPKTKANLNA